MSSSAGCSDFSSGNYEKENYRMKEYKTFGRDSKDFRRKFIESNVELRKCNKEDKLEKRRHIVCDDPQNTPDGQQEAFMYIIERLKKSKDQSEMGYLIRELRMHVSSKGYLAKDRDLMISVPILVSLLETPQNDVDIHNILWILTNLCYHPIGASYVMAIKQSLEIFFKLLHSTNFEIVTQALWLVANIVGETIEFARRVEQAGFLPVVLQLASSSTSVDFHELVIWFLGNFLRYNKNRVFEKQTLRSILDYIFMIFNTKNRKFYLEIMRCIDYVLVLNDEFCEYVVEKAPMDEWINVICGNVKTDLNTIKLFLRSIGHLVAGDNDTTAKCLSYGLVPALKQLYLSMRNDVVAKHMFWIFSNICVSPSHQRQSLLEHNVLEIFMDALTNYANHPLVLVELCWCFRNFIQESCLEEYEIIMSFDWMTSVIILCKTKTSALRVLEGCLRVFEAAFEKASKLHMLDNVLHAFSVNGGCDILESLQLHHSLEIYEISRELTERYFNPDDNEYDVDDSIQNSKDDKFEF